MAINSQILQLYHTSRVGSVQSLQLTLCFTDGSTKYACHAHTKKIYIQNICRGAIVVSLLLLNTIRYLRLLQDLCSTQYILPLIILLSMPTVLQKTEMIEEAFAGYGHKPTYTHTHTRLHTCAWACVINCFFIAACLWTLQKMRGLNWSAVLEPLDSTGGRCHRWAFTLVVYHTHLKVTGFESPDLECN